MSADEEMLYNFCTELHVNKSISDVTYDRVLKRFGEQGVIDTLGINGYYTFIAMVMNGARTAVPDNKPGALQPFPSESRSQARGASQRKAYSKGMACSSVLPLLPCHGRVRPFPGNNP